MRYCSSSLSGMPRMFWDPGFRLSHPDTFTQVFPFFTTKSAAIKSDSSSPTHATSSSSKLVQERLAHHLDLVEGDIADQVAQKSHHFFEVSNAWFCLIISKTEFTTASHLLWSCSCSECSDCSNFVSKWFSFLKSLTWSVKSCLLMLNQLLNYLRR